LICINILALNAVFMEYLGIKKLSFFLALKIIFKHR
jgi:hypothetical protein